jgi:hypothetical protein
MISTRVSTLYVLTGHGTNRYLFDFSRPLNGDFSERPSAAVNVHDKTEDGEAAVQLRVKGTESLMFRGATLFEDMSRAARELKTKVGFVFIRMGVGESVQVCFRVIDALTPLEPLEFDFGVLRITLPPTPEELPPGDD